MESHIDQLMNEADVPGCNSPVELGFRIKAIDGVERRIEELRATKRSYDEFFAVEEEKLRRQIEFLRSQMYIYLVNTGQKSVKTPVGLASITRRTKVDWPDDDILIGFSKDVGLPLRVKESPDRKAITAFVKETGNIPPGYHIHETEDVVVRKYDVPVEAAEPEEAWST